MRRRRSGLNFGRRKKKVNMTIVKEILSWTVEILITLVIAFTFVYFIGLRTSVVGQSMSETLESGDEILVNRFIYKVSDPKPNDIIVFLPNGNEKSHYYVKRVIAVPGDTVLIQNGAVYVNGDLFDEKVDVSAIEEADAEQITLKQDFGSVTQISRMNYPCLVTVDKDICVPRLPSWRLTKETQDRPVRVVTFDDLPRPDLTRFGAVGSPTRVERIFAPEAGAASVVLEGSAAEKADQLTKLLAERKYI